MFDFSLIHPNRIIAVVVLQGFGIEAELDLVFDFEFLELHDAVVGVLGRGGFVNGRQTFEQHESE
jgi:hypothetical protein